MMKDIVIKEANRGRIEAELEKVQGKCRERLIDYKRICDALKEVENELGIPKKALKGVSVNIDWNAQHFAKAYKYTPESTQFRAVHTGTAWKLTYVGRCACRVPNRRHLVTLTNDAKAAIIARMEQF